MELSIRPADLEATNQIAGWLPSQTEVTLFAGTALTWPLTGADLLSTTADGWTVLTFWHATDLVSTAAYRSAGPGRIRIGRILVDPRRRGRGLGRATVTALLARVCAQPGIYEITLGVFEHNTPARRLYASLGFCDTGARGTATVDGTTWTSHQLSLARHRPDPVTDR